MPLQVTVKRQYFALGVLLCVAGGVSAQPEPSTIGARVAAQPAVAAALASSDTLERWVVEQQVRLCEIPAPPFKEQARGEAVRRAFADLGLRRVRVDRVGNVIGEWGASGGQVTHLVFSAHLDTVFPEGTPVTVRREGARLFGPGITDDCRGLAVLLGTVKALSEAAIAVPGRVSFVATVGEEGLGDLRGVKHLFGPDGLGRIDRFVSIDGAGLEITNGGVGSRRYRVTFKGPGGHSYSAFGLPNPLHALGRAVATISALDVPASPRTTFNVGRVGGGTSVNSIPFEAWMEVDLRSESTAALLALDKKVRAAIDAAVVAENARWRHAASVTVDVALVGDRPAGRTPDTSDIVVAARSVLAALGQPAILDTSSTDANVPMARGIPAITIGGGGVGQASHSLEESFDTRGGVVGLRQAILLVVALAQP